VSIKQRHLQTRNERPKREQLTKPMLSLFSFR
jgi:hypothetical protein